MAEIALGWKPHSGWAALVALAASGKSFEIVERRRVELVPPDEPWAKAPYHAAEGLDPDEAEDVVRRGIASARSTAKKNVAALVKELRGRGHEVAACAVPLGTGMPDWTVAQILAVHMRMHKAEGELFRDVLVRAGNACGLHVVGIPEKELGETAAKRLRLPAAELARRLGEVGKRAGPPWAKDQKDAALAACVALAQKTA
jgi:hypothetical protein